MNVELRLHNYIIVYVYIYTFIYIIFLNINRMLCQFFNFFMYVFSRILMIKNSH